MKLIIEMDEEGNVNLETSDDEIDVATTVLLLEFVKMQLMGQWASTFPVNQMATPEDDNEISV